MNVGRVVQALRSEGEITVRSVLIRFGEVEPDVIGPPGRGPLIEELRADGRIDLTDWICRLRQ